MTNKISLWEFFWGAYPMTYSLKPSHTFCPKVPSGKHQYLQGSPAAYLPCSSFKELIHVCLYPLWLHGHMSESDEFQKQRNVHWINGVSNKEANNLLTWKRTEKVSNQMLFIWPIHRDNWLLISYFQYFHFHVDLNINCSEVNILLQLLWPFGSVTSGVSKLSEF